MPEDTQSSSRCHVNKKLLPIKGFYFFFLAAVGSLLPFIAIYMKSLGLTSSETGVLYGTMPFVGFFVRPFIGALADRWRKHKVSLMVSSVLTGVFYLLILTIPPRTTPSLVVHSQLDCNVQDSYFRDCVAPDNHLDQSTCDIGLSEFARVVSNSSSDNATDFDCDVTCTESTDSLSQGVGVCLTDLSTPFVHHCNGTQPPTAPLEFKLLNLSHVWRKEMVNGRITAGLQHCRDYDLKSLEHGGAPYWQLLCDEEGTFVCHMTCRDPPASLCQSHQHEFDSTFGWLFLVYLIANLVFSPVFSLSDAATFDTLGKDHHRFGEQRLWGTVGFALLAVTSTFIMYTMTSAGSRVDYTAPFYIFAGLCVLAGGAAYFMNLSGNVRCGNMFDNFRALMSVPQVLVFLLVVLFFGMATGAVEGFLFWFLLDLGATTPVFGLSLVVNCLFEVPVLFMSGKIIKRIGAVPCLYLALLALALRFLGYSLLTAPWQVLGIEPLHGVTFGLMWAAASTNAAMIAPPGMSATIQGLVGGVHFGIGKGLGSLLTGFLFARVGERWSFRIYSLAALGLLVVYAALTRLVFKAPLKSPATQEHDLKTDRDQATQLNDQPLLSTNSTVSDGADDLKC